MSDIKDRDINPSADDIFENETQAFDAFVSSPPAHSKRGLGWGAVLPLFLLAAVGGAIGGWALTQYVMPNYIALPIATAQIDTPKIDLGPLTQRVAAAEKKISAQSTELSFLSSEIKSGSASVTVGGVDETLDITPLLSRLSQLESRLENTNQPSAGSVLSLLRAQIPSGETDVPNTNLAAFEPRLAQLETALSEISGADQRASKTLAADLTAELDLLRMRVDQLETEIAAASVMAAAPTIVRETVLLPPFPREALLAAMTAPRDVQTGGWVSQTLKKHISVRNPQDVARANETLDEIETLAASRDYASALALIEAMPSDVRSAAGEWTRAVQAEIQTP